MKRTTLAAVLLLLAAMFFLQNLGLEKTEVQRLERASQNLGELRASSLLPTYIGSLFLGSFRAVAIDILWIQMQRMREQEHRYFETVEYMELITKLQPRNPEAWAYMAWDSGYNIANQYRTAEDVEALRRLERNLARDPKSEKLLAQRDKLKDRIAKKDEKYRIWVKRGLQTLVEACRHMPDDPYLHHDIGQTLWTKSAWSTGILEDQFIRAIEGDDDLQKTLGEGLPPGKRRSPFELAEVWFDKGEGKLKALIKEGRFRVYRTLLESMSRPADEDRQYHTTQMGRNIDIASFVGAIHQMRYYQGILSWYRARDAEPDKARALLLEASRSFSKAAEQAAIYRRDHSPTVLEKRAFHDARADLCRGMAQLCADQAKLPLPMSEADRTELLSRLERIRWNPVDRDAPPMEQIPPPDERYVLDYMTEVKKSLGGDGWEYNDDFHALHRGNLMETGHRVDATIGPDVKDVDYYHFYASVPGAPGQDAPAQRTIESVFHIKRMDAVPLTITAYSFRGRQLTASEPMLLTTDEEREFTITSDMEGSVYIRVTAGENAPAGRRGYWLKAMGVRR